jgi:hypothetical protein
MLEHFKNEKEQAKNTRRYLKRGITASSSINGAGNPYGGATLSTDCIIYAERRQTLTKAGLRT